MVHQSGTQAGVHAWLGPRLHKHACQFLWASSFPQIPAPRAPDPACARLPEDHFLKQGAAVPTAADMAAMRALPADQVWTRWKESLIVTGC